MKRNSMLLFAGIICAGLCVAQSPQGNSSAAAPSDKPATIGTQAQSEGGVPAGAVIAAELSKSIDAKKAKTGDKVEAKIAMDVLSQGKIVIPRDSKVFGHVVDAKAHSKNSAGSTLSISFDRIALKGGNELPLHLRIQAIGRPLQLAALADSSPMSDPGASASSQSSVSVGIGGASPRAPGSAPGAYPGTSPSSTDSAPPPEKGPAPLAPTSQGVVGIKGLELKSDAQSSVISSEKDNVKLESGTQILLRTN